MKALSFALLGAVLTISAAPPAVSAAQVIRSDALLPVEHVGHQLLLDGGTKAYLGADHKLYILGASGKYAPARSGHYMLADGGCVTVGADEAVDPASFARLSKSEM